MPVEELLSRQEMRLKQVLDKTRASLNEVAGEPNYEYVWNAHGYAEMLEHVRAVMRQTQKQLLLAVWPTEAAVLEDTVKELALRGVEILTLCINACPPVPCGFCHGTIYRYAFVPTRPIRWLVMVSDNAELAASEISSQDQALTIRTRQPLFIDLARSNMRNSIALAALVSDLGKGLDEVLQSETRKTLGAIAPEGWGADWLEKMRAAKEEASRGKS